MCEILIQKSLKSGAIMFRIRSWFHYLLAVKSWESYWISLGFKFLFCKIQMMILRSFRITVSTKWVNTCECLKLFLAHRKCSIVRYYYYCDYINCNNNSEGLFLLFKFYIGFHLFQETYIGSSIESFQEKYCVTWYLSYVKIWFQVKVKYIKEGFMYF